MRYRITPPNHIDTTVKLPASKSISNRALVIHALSGGEILPDNLSDCDDTDVIVSALQDMPYTIDIKAAGTAMRFMTASASPSGFHPWARMRDTFSASISRRRRNSRCAPS